MSAFSMGLVGTGIMGRRMLTALAAHATCRAAVLWDPSVAQIDAARALAPDARIATGLADLVADDTLDLVYVASPPTSHRANVEAALAAGRACLCEKPLAADVAEAVALRDTVVASGLPFAINFPFASAPAARALQALVADGSLGRVTRATLTVRFAAWPRPWQEGAAAWLAADVEGGFTREVLSHFVFLSTRLFGPATVADVNLTRAPGHAETALAASLVHREVTVSIDAQVAGDVADRNRFELVGERGSVALVDWGRLERDGTLTDRVDATPGTLDRLPALVAGRTDHGLATADEGVAVVRIVEALLAT